MYKKSIFLILFLVLSLGLFFQYNRSHGFLHLLKNNNISAGFATKGASLANFSDEYLIIYSSDVHSLFLKRQVEDLLQMQKKNVSAQLYTDNIDWSRRYTAIIITMADIERLGSMQQYEEYVQSGGSMCFAEPPVALNKIANKIGIASVGPGVTSYGLEVKTDILLRGRGFELTSPQAQIFVYAHKLLPDALVHINTQQGIPILWEQAYGRGKFIVYNTAGLGNKSNRGVLTGILSLTKEHYLYPIIGVKTVFIDSFPAPSSTDSFEPIYQEYHLSVGTFFRQVWWPEMLRIASLHNVKYTGMVIESNNKSMIPAFPAEHVADTSDNLGVYGSDLLKSGGELGINGYNNQPLVLAKDRTKALAPDGWQSGEAMEASLLVLKSYIKEVFPNYRITSYAAPKNIFSVEGKRTVKQVFPGIKVFSSLYTGPKTPGVYYQNFAKNTDGTFELPRVTSGFVVDERMKWDSLNVLSTWGVLSHFVNPYELVAATEENISWRTAQEGFTKWLGDNQANYPWLRATTAAEAAAYMDDYFDLSYIVEENPDDLLISCKNFRKEVYFILKTKRKIFRAQGCKLEAIDANAYLVKIAKPTAKIIFERELK